MQACFRDRWGHNPETAIRSSSDEIHWSHEAGCMTVFDQWCFIFFDVTCRGLRVLGSMHFVAIWPSEWMDDNLPLRVQMSNLVFGDRQCIDACLFTVAECSASYSKWLWWMVIQGCDNCRATHMRFCKYIVSCGLYCGFLWWWWTQLDCPNSKMMIYS